MQKEGIVFLNPIKQNYVFTLQQKNEKDFSI